nr:RNA-directed DNA polymerase, eukaryota, reverse transcriptase zinc-binding domain protein [Tanacetum cinerariifolium]
MEEDYSINVIEVTKLIDLNKQIIEQDNGVESNGDNVLPEVADPDTIQGNGLFKGIQIQGSMAISHLFYADDAVFIGEWSDFNLDNIVKILKCFFLASGLKINIQKSQVLGVGVPRNIVNQAASLIGCAIMQNPFRLTLLKSVVGASPLYNMSIYKVPKGVLKEMEAIRCNFFNGTDPAERKITWVSWDKVLASKKNGGLGVSSFHALNRALLQMWVWRFLSQDGSLWYRVIQALYGDSFELHPVNQSSIWFSILREMQVLISKGFDFVSHCKKRVGDGHNTRFWYDSWVFDQPLRVRFPRLFALEMDKESTWDDLNSVSGSITLSASKDRWICDLNDDGVFRVKEVRTILDDIFLPSGVDATRWVKYIPIKINVFAWRARLDRLPTRIEGTYYDTIDEAIDMYTTYADMAGFEVKKLGQRLTKSGAVQHKYIMCNREGVSKGINVDTLDPEYSDKPKRNTTTHVTGCKARIKLVLNIVTGRYKLEQFHAKHNHMLIPKEYKHLIKKQRKMTQGEKMFVVKAATNKISATRAHNLLSSMKGGYEYVHETTDDFKNHKRDVNVFIDENPIRNLRDYSKPSHEGYRKTIELSAGNNVVPLRSDTIRLVQNGCSFHGLQSEDPNQHLKDFLKLVDSLDLDGESRERTRSITTWEDLTTRFLAQFFPPGRTVKLRYDILMFQQHHRESLSEAWTPFKDLLQKVPHQGIDHWLQGLRQAGQGNRIALRCPAYIRSPSNRARNSSSMLDGSSSCSSTTYPSKKITTPYEICSGPHDTQYCMENPEQAFFEYTSSHTDEAGGLVSEFMAFQDAKLTKFEADFKQQQGEMTNKIDTVLKAITSQIAGALPSDTVKNPKLETHLEDGDVMFIEIIQKDDDPREEEPEVELQEVEYFNIFPTRSELVMRRKLNPRENSNGGVSNFTGRVKGMHFFIGNFTYVVDFMIVEDISSIINPRLSHVILRIPFIEISNMTHDLPKGVVKFTNENDEVAYKMPHKIEQYSTLSNLEKEHIKSVYLRNEEDKRRRVEYVMSKILGFYKECLELGPEFLMGIEEEGEVT